MVLADTSVWREHLRFGNVGLEAVLDEGNIACQSFIIGENNLETGGQGTWVKETYVLSFDESGS